MSPILRWCRPHEPAQPPTCRLRLLLDEDIAFGPGKAELLDRRSSAAGSISAAAKTPGHVLPPRLDAGGDDEQLFRVAAGQVRQRRQRRAAAPRSRRKGWPCCRRSAGAWSRTAARPFDANSGRCRVKPARSRSAPCAGTPASKGQPFRRDLGAPPRCRPCGLGPAATRNSCSSSPPASRRGGRTCPGSWQRRR